MEMATRYIIVNSKLRITKTKIVSIHSIKLLKLSKILLYRERLRKRGAFNHVLQ